MPIRVLCLHGQGVNSAIFRKQTEHVREMLPPDYEFHFFDGKYECEPAPEVLDFFPPPYLTWYNTPTAKRVAEAHRQVRQIVEDHGPFDAVIGFSQGAAVAASLLLHQELDGQEEPLFKAAIFIGSPLPFSYRTDVGIDARKYFGLAEDPPNAHGRPTEIPPHLITDPAYLRNPAQLDGKTQQKKTTTTTTTQQAGPGGQPELQPPDLADMQYQMFHPTSDAVRIQVPTGHVFGSRDKWYRHSRDLVGLCREDRRSVFEHDGGHEVPRAYTEELCDLIETVLSKVA